MNKDWEDEFDEKYWNEEFGASKIKAFIAKNLSRAVAKERTQLLKEVREKVIGENTSDVPKFKYSFSSNNWREEQLKKLILPIYHNVNISRRFDQPTYLQSHNYYQSKPIYETLRNKVFSLKPPLLSLSLLFSSAVVPFFIGYLN